METFRDLLCEPKWQRGLPVRIFGSRQLPSAVFLFYRWTSAPWTWSDSPVSKAFIKWIQSSSGSACIFGYSNVSVPLHCRRTIDKMYETYVIRYYHDYSFFYTNEYWTKNATVFRAVQCFHVCSLLQRIYGYSHLSRMSRPVCPDACRFRKPCKHLEMYTDHHRPCISTGIYRHSFICQCKRGYTYNRRFHRCSHVNLCTLPESCDHNGTSQCYYNNDSEEYYCDCKKGFTGKNCTETVNACLKIPSVVSGGDEHILCRMRGNRACNVNSGNACIPKNYSYRCRCSNGWSPDISFPCDNCLKRKQPCDSIICINGKCLASEDGSKGRCVCNKGYGGSVCGRWVGAWSKWSNWDRCRPDCGNHRWTFRERRCESHKITITKRTDCEGSPVEYEACVDHPCSFGLEDFLSEYIAIRKQALNISIALNILLALAITILWKTFFAKILHKWIYYVKTVAAVNFFTGVDVHAVTSQAALNEWKLRSRGVDDNKSFEKQTDGT